MGPVEVETVEYGRGSSTVTFTYWDPSQQPEDRVPVFVEEETAAPTGTVPVADSNTSVGNNPLAPTSIKRKLFGENFLLSLLSCAVGNLKYCEMPVLETLSIPTCWSAFSG